MMPVPSAEHHPQPTLIAGLLARDERGSVAHVNAFDFGRVRRSYVIDNKNVGQPRAWHGHWREEKWVFVVAGAAVICAADMRTGRVLRFELREDVPVILHIPGGWANGSMSMEPHTKIVHYSSATLDESKGDDVRFPLDRFADVWWGEEDFEPLPPSIGVVR